MLQPILRRAQRAKAYPVRATDGRHPAPSEPTASQLLSEDPANYRDAPTEGIRRILEEGAPLRLPLRCLLFRLNTLH